MITRKQAEQAKEKLALELVKHPWFKGITLGLGGGGISIRVSVDLPEVTDEVRALVPTSCDEVDVILEPAIVSTPFDMRWLK